MLPEEFNFDDNDDDDAELVDQQSIQDIITKVQDAIRPIGLSMRPEDVQVAIQNGKTFMIFPTIVRPSAKERLTRDRETQEQLNKMLAAQHEEDLKEQAEKIANLASDPEKLMAALFGEGVEAASLDECPKGGEHQPHPEGWCMKCHQGMND